MSPSIVISGSYKGASGHDHHNRSIVRELHKRGLTIELRDLPNWTPVKLPSDQQDRWFDQFGSPVKANVHLHFCMPHQVEISQGMRNVNFTMFEADRIPSAWKQESIKHDLVVVPVESCKRAWVASGVREEKIAVCPLGVDAEMFRPGIDALPIRDAEGRCLSQFSNRFLNVSDAIERKNLHGLLHAWLIATKKSDDAALLMKVSFSQPGARSRFFLGLQRLEATIGKTVEEAAPIFWITDILAPHVMPSVYGSATHYISMSRGEGFDMPMVEAGVSGLQLIAPRHSAYLDYLHNGIAHLISACEQEAVIRDDPGAARLFEGACWWEPDLNEASEIICNVVNAKAPKRQLARASLSKLSWVNTAQRIEELVVL